MTARSTPAALLVALVPTFAHAQDDPEILYASQAPWASRPISTALGNLGLSPELHIFPEDLLAALRRQAWDLVIIRWPAPYPPDVYFEILGELTAHVDGGGALMFSIAELDQMPEYWPLLGIARAVDLELPLSNIRSAHATPHPGVEHGGMNVNNEVFGPDYGNVLTPASGAFIVDVYVGSGAAAITIAHRGRVIVNGQEWDEWDVANGIDMAVDQIDWLLGCPADLDGDGDLTVFDFFEFQNRFDSGDGFVDFDYDGRIDVFDFLEFFNLFEAGC